MLNRCSESSSPSVSEKWTRVPLCTCSMQPRQRSSPAHVSRQNRTTKVTMVLDGMDVWAIAGLVWSAGSTRSDRTPCLPAGARADLKLSPELDGCGTPRDSRSSSNAEELSAVRCRQRHLTGLHRRLAGPSDLGNTDSQFTRSARMLRQCISRVPTLTFANFAPLPMAGEMRRGCGVLQDASSRKTPRFTSAVAEALLPPAERPRPGPCVVS